MTQDNLADLLNPLDYEAMCRDLAEVYLAAHPHLDTLRRTAVLATLIQNLIENFIALENENYDGANE